MNTVRLASFSCIETYLSYSFTFTIKNIKVKKYMTVHYMYIDKFV